MLLVGQGVCPSIGLSLWPKLKYPNNYWIPFTFAICHQQGDDRGFK